MWKRKEDRGAGGIITQTVQAMRSSSTGVHLWNNRHIYLHTIKGSSATEVWKKLVAIHSTRGNMFTTDLLNKLQMIGYTEGDDMRTHLGSMKAICE